MNTSHRLAVSLLAILGLCLSLPLAAAVPPRVSPTGTVSQVVGVSNVEIVYSRPSVRGREIFGDLVPYGEVWRTGANEATTFTIEHDATIEGKPLAAGTYALFTIPGADSWTLIFSTQSDLWGSYGHEEPKDALRVEVKPMAAPFAEMLTFNFPAVSSEGGQSETTVRLHWAEVAVSFHVAFGTDAVLDVARAAVTDAMGAEPDARTANSWIGFLYSNDLALGEVEGWAAKVSQAAPADFTSHALHARLLAKNGKTAAAVAAATTALSLAPAEPTPRVADDIASLRADLAKWQAGN
jgi:hypothetical protein